MCETDSKKCPYWNGQVRKEDATRRNFSRYDPIVKDFNDNKLTKVVNIMRRILQTPSKRAVQKLGQDLTSETGFDEHLYFTD